jgi:uncharacterized protein YkwD
MRLVLGLVFLCLLSVPAPAADHAGSINAYRRANGLPAVKTDGALTALAQRQASAMARAGTIGHDIGGSFASRVSSLRRSQAAENVAAGHSDFATTLKQWVDSAGHRRNLLMRGATRVGVASASNPASRYKTFWALIITN